MFSTNLPTPIPGVPEPETYAMLLAGLAALGFASAHAAVDTVQYSTGYFVDVDANKTQSPYYRWNGDDWG